MTYPTIHRNGTGAEALQEQWREAHSKLVEALGAMEAAAPNGRDYYPQGAAALREAVTEYNQHISAVRAARNYFLALHVHVDSL